MVKTKTSATRHPLQIGPDTHHLIRLAAFLSRKTMRDVTGAAVREYVARRKWLRAAIKRWEDEGR